MRVLLLALALVLPGTASGAAQSPEPVNPAAGRETLLERQTREVSSQLRCVVCQGLSIQDSPSSLAQEMKGVVREQLAQGRSPEQVKQYFVDKYGEQILLEPRATGFNLLVYVLPVVMLLGGALFVYLKAQQWSKRPDTAPVEVEADAPR